LNAWELIIQQPVTNVLIVLSYYLGSSFGLAVIALTIIINLCMLPLTLSQLRSTKAMQALQPRLLEIQQKYAKDKQKLAQEQMKLYKESGVKPAGCAITMLIQLPVWYAVYQAVILALAVAPEALLNLSRFLYPWPMVYDVLPLSQHFLWMNLAQPDLVLAILVGVTMWVQQKMSTMPSTDPRQQQQTQMMLWMMPLMFVLLSLSFPSGLALYWVANSIVRIAMQYKVTGWGGLVRSVGKKEEAKGKKYVQFGAAEDKTGADIAADSVSQKKEGQVIYPEKPSKSRYQPGRDRARHRKK
jgi:YidC/Oxa1 family membrane protein insertase